MQIIVAALVGLLTMLTITPQDATACSCSPPIPPLEAAASADAVFLAEITAIKGDEEEIDDQHSAFMQIIREWLGLSTPVRRPMSYDLHVQFEVVEAYKGVELGSGDLKTNASGSLCGYTSFEKGETFLIYGQRDREDGLRTNLCMRTKPASGAEDEIRTLRGEYIE